jgi:hypothetical protein
MPENADAIGTSCGNWQTGFLPYPHWPGGDPVGQTVNLRSRAIQKDVDDRRAESHDHFTRQVSKSRPAPQFRGVGTVTLVEIARCGTSELDPGIEETSRGLLLGRFPTLVS